MVHLQIREILIRVRIFDPGQGLAQRLQSGAVCGLDDKRPSVAGGALECKGNKYHQTTVQAN